VLTHDTPRTRGAGTRLVPGLGLAVLSASSFGLSGSLARGLMDAGWSSAAAVVVRILLAAAGLTLGGLTLLVAGATGILTLTASTRPVAFEAVTVPWWLPVLALGVVTAALAYGTGIAAARRLGSRLASFVALSEVLVALVAAWVLLGEVPRLIQVAGGVLILAGVVSVKLGEPRG